MPLRKAALLEAEGVLPKPPPVKRFYTWLVCVPKSWVRMVAYRNLTIAAGNGLGLYGRAERILTYSPIKTPHFEFKLWDGIFADGWIWGIALTNCAITTLIGVLHRNVEGKDRLDVLEYISTSMYALTAFVLASFVANVVATWKERRTNYASLIGSMRNLLILLSSSISTARVPGVLEEQPSENVRLIRESRARLGRYVLLSCEIAVLKPRGHMDSAEGRASLERLGLLETGEWDAMVPGDRHTTVFCWIQSMVVALRRRGILLESEVHLIGQGVGAARSQANDLMSSLNRDLPLPYVNLVAWLVQFAMLLNSINNGVRMSGYSDTGAKVSAALSTFLYSAAFRGLLNVHRLLHNPFIDRLIDVAHEPIVNGGLATLARSLMADESYLPPAWSASSSSALDAQGGKLTALTSAPEIESSKLHNS